jgi:ribosomal protein S5
LKQFFFVVPVGLSAQKPARQSREQKGTRDLATKTCPQRTPRNFNRAKIAKMEGGFSNPPWATQNNLREPRNF